MSCECGLHTSCTCTAAMAKVDDLPWKEDALHPKHVWRRAGDDTFRCEFCSRHVTGITIFKAASPDDEACPRAAAA